MASAIRLCIYDKAAELKKMAVSDPAKLELMLKYCLGENYAFAEPLTRIEFRLRRSALKELEINSVQDLMEREKSLFDWLTKHWFRLLAEPKVRGHENTAALHPLWEQVRSAFTKWFPGGERVVERHKIEPVSCDPAALEKQAAGCLAISVALRFGKQKDERRFAELVYEVVGSLVESMFGKANLYAERLLILRGILLGKELESVHYLLRR